jgi:NAD(P)-dependent dehydrogenase (short-subunit alcohol dehydrogenase family)
MRAPTVFRSAFGSMLLTMTELESASRHWGDTGRRPPLAWIAGVGASAGLGAAVARRFAREGYVVVLTGRSGDRLRAIAGEISAAGGQAFALPGDVSHAEEVAELGSAVEALGTLNVAVFNAGNAVRGTPLEITPDQFESTWRSSAYAGFLFAREAIGRLLTAGGGSLLFTGATASLRGRGPFVAFASAKAGLRSIAQSCAREYGPQGIHVAHVIVDGGIDGDRLRGLAPQRVADAGDDGLLHPDAIAETYWQLHRQPRNAWTHEIDLRPFKEAF